MCKPTKISLSDLKTLVELLKVYSDEEGFIDIEDFAWNMDKLFFDKGNICEDFAAWSKGQIEFVDDDDSPMDDDYYIGSQGSVV